MMKYRKALYILKTTALLCILSAGKVFSQETQDFEKAFPVVEKVFNDFATQNHYPALVYGIVKDGKLVYTGATGFINIEKKYPATAQSDFRIASMTKSFVSVAILQLRDAGKLRLDDPASMYIPELKDQKYLSTDAPVITIRHLLTHSAGFPEDNPWGDRQLAITNEQFTNMLKKGISFSNVPGIAYEYSNMGFAMLGYIVQKVSGETYANYITNHILKPLGMSHTYFEYGKVPGEQLAHGYRWLNNSWVEQPMLHDGTYGAMGGMITTMEDFAKYVTFQLSAWPPRDGREEGPLKRSSLREMQQPWRFNNLNSFSNSSNPCPVVSAYGYGLRWSKDCKGVVSVGHTGGLPGFGSNWVILPDYGIGIISFSNLTYASASYINGKVVDTLLKLTGLKPRPIPVSPILEQRKNELVKLLPDWRNSTSQKIFAENFFMDYFEDSLRNEAQQIFKKAGKIINIRELIPENNLRGAFIIEGENADIKVSFTLTPETPALIQAYDIEEVRKTR